MAYLELSDIRKSFGQTQVVKSFDLAVDKGEFVSFLGPSGCGKTTVLRMIAGFEAQTSGAITVDGQEISHLPANRRNIGMVFQAYALFPNMTVGDNVAFGLKIAGMAPADRRKRVGEMLEMIRLTHLAHRYPYQLSGGQQQRVALARALALRPKILLLDEPLSALDAKIRVSLREEIRAVQRALGITTIFVTHDQEEALSMSDRVVVMHDGRAEQIGTPFEVYNYPRTRFVASFVGTLNVIDAEIRDRALGRIAIAGQEVTLSRSLDGAGVHNGRLQVALRPEAVGPLDGDVAAAGPGNRLRAKVVDVSYYGPLVRVKAQVGDSVVSFDRFNAITMPPPAIGTELVLGFREDDVLPLADA
jgi:putative spermidine/putrescine transport system ATP-binding protein